MWWRLLRLRKAQVEELKTMAEIRGISVSKLVRAVLDRFMREERRRLYIPGQEMSNDI